MSERPPQRIAMGIPDGVPTDLWAEVIAFLEELNKESARGRVLVSAAMLEDQLGAILRAFLVQHPHAEKLFSGVNAPFGTFQSRALACVCLGLITEEEFEGITIIRKIRNEFAHNVQISFSKSSRIRDLVSNFKLVPNRRDSEGPETWFGLNAVMLIAALSHRAAHVEKKRLEYGNWGW